MAQRKEIWDELQEIAPELTKFGPITPYLVPAGYFDTLAESVLRRIKALEAGDANEELESLSPLLKSLRKEPTFMLPEGYFNTLSPNLLSDNIEKKEARVIKMSFGSKVLRYAAAAVVIGLITLAGWKFFDRSPATNRGLVSHDDTVAQKEMLRQVQGFSDNEILAFVEGSESLLNASSLLNDETALASAEIKDEDVKLMLADVSDQDLERYLKEKSIN